MTFLACKHNTLNGVCRHLTDSSTRGGGELETSDDSTAEVKPTTKPKLNLAKPGGAKKVKAQVLNEDEETSSSSDSDSDSDSR